MTSTALGPGEVLGFVDVENGLVDRRIFSDEEIYRLELEHIFARAWNFMAHESQIPNPGDFFLTYIGEDRVIVVRDKEGGLQVLLNTCRHRGNAVCRAEEGHATSVHVHLPRLDLRPPGQARRRPRLQGLLPRGPQPRGVGPRPAREGRELPGLHLRDARPGGARPRRVPRRRRPHRPRPSSPSAATSTGRRRHPEVHHRLQLEVRRRQRLGLLPRRSPTPRRCMAGWRRRTRRAAASSDSSQLQASTQNVVLGEYGHAIGGPPQTTEALERARARSRCCDNELARAAARRSESSAPVGIESGGHPNIFPNLWVSPTQPAQPAPAQGPDNDRDLVVHPRRRRPPRSAASRLPSTRRHPHLRPGRACSSRKTARTGTRAPGHARHGRPPLPPELRHGPRPRRGHRGRDGPAHIDTRLNEHAQLWHYRSWAEWMAADSWPDLKATFTRAPRHDLRRAFSPRGESSSEESSSLNHVDGGRRDSHLPRSRRRRAAGKPALANPLDNRSCGGPGRGGAIPVLGIRSLLLGPRRVLRQSLPAGGARSVDPSHLHGRELASLHAGLRPHSRRRGPNPGVLSALAGGAGPGRGSDLVPRATPAAPRPPRPAGRPPHPGAGHPALAVDSLLPGGGAAPSRGRIVVFSDEIDWCRQNLPAVLPGRRLHFYEGVPRPPEEAYHASPVLDWIDLQLMASCDHHIIANSTLAWWGAFLSADAAPIYPSHWYARAFKGMPASLMFPPGWREIEDPTQNDVAPGRPRFAERLLSPAPGPSAMGVKRMVPAVAPTKALCSASRGAGWCERNVPRWFHRSLLAGCSRVESRCRAGEPAVVRERVDSNGI